MVYCVVMKRVLAFFEKFLRTDIRYLARGGFFMTLINISSAVVGFVLTIAFANLIPQETYGTYRYILSAYAFLALFALPGLDMALTRATSQGADGAYLRTAKIKLRWGFLGTCAAGVVALWYGVHGNTTLALLFLSAGVAVPLLESMQLYGPFLNGKKKFGLWSALEIGVQVSSSLALLAALFFSTDIFLIITVYFFATGAARAGAFFIALRQALHIQNTGGGELTRYGKELTLYDIVGRGAAALDSFVLWHFMGPREVALFALAIAVPMRMQSLLKISGTLSFPKFTDRAQQDVARSLPRKMLFFGAGILLLSGVYALLAEPFFTFFFPAYVPSVPYSQVLVFYTLSAVTYPFSTYLLANKRLKETYLITGVNACVKIVTLLVCVPLFGLWGAVLSYLLSSLSNILIVSILMIRSHLSAR